MGKKLIHSRDKKQYKKIMQQLIRDLSQPLIIVQESLPICSMLLLLPILLYFQGPIKQGPFLLQLLVRVGALYVLEKVSYLLIRKSVFLRTLTTYPLQGVVEPHLIWICQ